MKPIELVEKEPLFIQCLSELGNAGSASEQIINHLEEFTCGIYVQPRFSSVEKLTPFKMKKKVECGNI